MRPHHHEQGGCPSLLRALSSPWCHWMSSLFMGVMVVSPISSLHLSTGIASAEPPQPAQREVKKSQADRQLNQKRRALKLLRSGEELFVKRQYTDAIKSWREAYSLFSDPKLLYYIASAYERLKDHCEDEERAWSAYFMKCADGSCYHHKDALTQRETFSKRCYVDVQFSSNASQAEVKIGERVYGLPHRQKMLRRMYTKIKVRAPAHLSEWIDLDLDKLPRDQIVYEAQLMLTPLPKLGYFNRHHTVITIGAAITGVALMSFGSLKMSDAIATRDQVVSELANIEQFPTPEAQNAERYHARKRSFESDQTMGVAFLALGGVTLGVSAWLFIQDRPHEALYDKARLQGDIAITSPVESPTASWRFTPTLGGAQLNIDF